MKGSTADSAPWFTSMTRWPRASRPMSLMFGRTRSTVSRRSEGGAVTDSTACFASAMSRQCYTTGRRKSAHRARSAPPQLIERPVAVREREELVGGENLRVLEVAEVGVQLLHAVER